MGLRDLFTTARLVSLLVMTTTTSSATPGWAQTSGLSVPSAHDLNNTSQILLRLSLFMDRLDLRLETMDAKMNNIERVDIKLKTMELKIKSLDAITNNIDRLDVKLETIEAKIKNIDRLDAKLETIEAKMQPLEDSLKDKFNRTKKEMEELWAGILILTNTIEDHISVMKSDVKNSWQQFQLNTEENASKTINAFQSVAKKLNNTFVERFKSAYTDLFSPQICNKNGLLFYPYLAQYTVIGGKEIPGLDTEILCDTVTDRGGWIVIQRRVTGEVDFYRGWASYKAGFGSVDNDFWLGNDNIHTITSIGQYELRVEIKYRGESKFANYGNFSIDGGKESYTLHVGSYSGTAGDSLEYQNGQNFSTFDHDNDLLKYSNCAEFYHGAWWYKDCHHSNLNGRWGSGNTAGLVWLNTTGCKSAEFSEMKIRRLNE
ncbi:hypothetical protein EGW08_014714 [Elysia chlorotica]|uniref:Fibrinogen C-terminal domain-containing protein n=1 Tax=Elysia chlorotica TaxID=188477 RepID=A0A433T7M5_ELYCH|nr:hypothetical protein EGW08_014714 [Elysia chlorotica]